MSEETNWKERGGYIYRNNKGQTILLIGNTTRVLTRGN
mgnify:CR=1 FL=1|jgi:hypothetical protein